MELFEAKKKLAVLWFILSGCLFALLLIQSFLGNFEGNANQAWNWFFPNVLPTLSLMISVFVFDLKSGKQNRTIDKFYFRMSFWLSSGYFLTILATILIEPISVRSIIEILEDSNLYLGPFQALVTGSIGFLFVRSEE